MYYFSSKYIRIFYVKNEKFKHYNNCSYPIDCEPIKGETISHEVLIYIVIYRFITPDITYNLTITIQNIQQKLKSFQPKN